MKIAAWSALACLLLGGCDAAVPPPAPQDARPKGPAVVHMDVVAGHELALMTVNGLDKHCTVLADLFVKATALPAHGTVQITQIMAFQQYGKGSPLAACGPVRAPMTRVIYHPAPGYTGDDSVVMAIGSADKPTAHTIRFEISVDGSF